MSADEDMPNSGPPINDTRDKWIAYGGYVGMMLAAWIAWLWKCLLGTLPGVLLLSTTTYFIAFVCGLRVFTPGELVFWFSEQSEGAQVAIGGGVLAALGLVAAYWTAVGAWKAQKEIELRVETASRLQELFQVVHRCAVDIGGYVSELRESARRAALGLTPADKAAHLYYTNSRAPEFERGKQVLHEARMALHGMFSTHGNVLVNSWGVFERLRAAMAMIDSAALAAVKVAAPHGDPRSPNFGTQYLSIYNDGAAIQAIIECTRVTELAAPIIGFVTGRLTQQAIKPRLGGLLLLSRRPRFFAPVFHNIRRAKPPEFPSDPNISH